MVDTNPDLLKDAYSCDGWACDESDRESDDSDTDLDMIERMISADDSDLQSDDESEKKSDDEGNNGNHEAAALHQQLHGASTKHVEPDATAMRATIGNMNADATPSTPVTESPISLEKLTVEQPGKVVEDEDDLEEAPPAVARFLDAGRKKFESHERQKDTDKIIAAERKKTAPEKKRTTAKARRELLKKVKGGMDSTGAVVKKSGGAGKERKADRE